MVQPLLIAKNSHAELVLSVEGVAILGSAKRR